MDNKPRTSPPRATPRNPPRSYMEDTTRGLPRTYADMERLDEDPRVAEIMRQQAEENRRRAAASPGMKKGGMVKKMAKGGMVRGDGCAMRGKTKGKIV